MTPAPKRRWFRFSLRTLFVVLTMMSVAMAWSNWNLNQVRERERLFHARDVRPKMLLRKWPEMLPNKSIPWSWSLFGAKPCRCGLFLPSDRFTNEDFMHYREMFPEALVVRDRASDSN